MLADELEQNVITYRYNEPDCLPSITALQSILEKGNDAFKPAGFRKEHRGGRNRCIEHFTQLARRYEVEGSFLGLEANRPIFMLSALRGNIQGEFTSCEKTIDHIRFENQVPCLQKLYKSLKITVEKQDIKTIAKNNPGKYAFIDYDAMKLIKPDDVKELVNVLVGATRTDKCSCLLIASTMKSYEGGGKGFLTTRYKKEVRPLLYREISKTREILENTSIAYRDSEQGGIPLRVEIYVLGPR